MGKFKDLITIEITIEQAIKAIARSSGDIEDVVIRALAQILFIEAEIPKSGFIGRGIKVSTGKSPLVQNGFHLCYKKYDKPTIPEEKYIRVICRICNGTIADLLFEVAEKGWKGVFIDPNHIFY